MEAALVAGVGPGLGAVLAREFHPKGIHVVHPIVDGQIDTPKLRAREPACNLETAIAPDAVTAAVIHAYHQPCGA